MNRAMEPAVKRVTGVNVFMSTAGLMGIDNE